jgi:nickel/cobalt transporter (NicO) family protein
MSPEILALIITALSIGFFHTLFGPDHYLPFIAMAQAKKWSMKKTVLITSLCGIGHVLSSVLLGFFGIAVGIAVFKLENIESIRGDFAGWLLLIFGFVYCVWGIWRAIKNKPHTHWHSHHDGPKHEHTHSHTKDHAHVHGKKANITPWVLFTIFVFGPCEPLIPLLMYPAAKASITGLILVTLAFSITTIGTMLGVVVATTYGVNFLPVKKLERYTHALAGFTIFMCGFAVQVLGL